MPRNGDINERFAVYRSVCCGREILLRENQRFPDCPRHRNLPTIWTPIVSDETINLLKGKKKNNPVT
jgi:hypothetical protein